MGNNVYKLVVSHSNVKLPESIYIIDSNRICMSNHQVAMPCQCLQEHLGREFFHIEGSYLVKVVGELACLSLNSEKKIDK